MSPLDALLAALGALAANPLRSMLTTLGIVIGVAAVITMLAIGRGAEARMQALIDSLGSNLITVRPGAATTGGVRAGNHTTLTEDDARAIAAELPEVAGAVPELRGNGQLVHGNRNWSAYVAGVTPDFLNVRDWTLDGGRFFTEDEVRAAAKVAVVGATVVEKLFDGVDPVGLTVRLDRVPFRVIGTLLRKGESPWGRDQDDVVLVPLDTARKRVLGRELGGGRIDAVSVEAASAEQIDAASAQIVSLLRQRHRLAEGEPDDFTVRPISEVMASRVESSKVMTRLLAAVALVSLAVGGIGIMNIMLVSVTERTREIGLRMALGAESRHILAQFLIEAVTLSLAGGALGALTGVGLSMVAAETAGWPVLVGFDSLLLALGFAAGVGIFFGWYPAYKASLMDPIAALRHE
ncbi:MAG: ABC transporter permease [Alphaproteobacteria bacterium]|nr:ABC transporter permease [Alphaproteobacteria bacterium]